MAYRVTALRRLAVRPLPPLGAPCLRAVAKEVPESMFGTPELDRIVGDLVDTMKDANGAGIAGPQIGEPWRVFVVHGSGDNPRYPYKPAIPLTVFVNPVVEVVDDAPLELVEGCLSIPGFRGRVRRATTVRCAARRPDGSAFSVLADGLASGTVQHEFDHLEGVLFPDVALPGGMMTGDGFEAYHKDAFFAYARAVNAAHPTPWTAEEGGGVAVGAVGTVGVGAKETARSATTSYAAGAAWIDGAVARDALVTVDDASGRIVGVAGTGGRAAVREEAAVDLGARSLLLPGFVNAHSHAFQRGLRGRGESYPRAADGSETPSFWTWREAMYGLVEATDSVAAFEAQTRQCFEEMAAAGITTVGEFHYFHHPANGSGYDHDAVVIDAARAANVRVVLLNAVYERGGFDDAPLGGGQKRFATPALDEYWARMDALGDRVGDAVGARRGDALGVVAHSLRAVGAPTLEALAAGAHARDMCFHFHIEEQMKEIEDCVAVHGKTPMALLLDVVDGDHLSRATAVHATHTRPDELARFLERGGGVCVCPLTEASLGDGVFGPLGPTAGRVSLGSDCNARIDFFEEMRWLEYSQRLARHRRGAYAAVAGDAQGDLAAHLLECATLRGAESLDVDAGSIDAGNFADFALVDLDAPALAGADDASLIGACVFGGAAEGLVLDTCVAGDWTRRSAAE